MLARDSVNCLRSIVACVVVAVWLPATSHCLLASINWVADDCCGKAQNLGSAPTQEHQDCARCTNLESGGLESAVVFAAILPPPVMPLPISFDEFAPAVFPRCIWGDVSPPDLPARWQFLTRAALPARTPAICS